MWHPFHYPDSRGRDVKVAHADTAHKTVLQYDPVSGNTLQATDPRGNSTRYHLDAVGRVDTTYLPASGAWAATYGVLNEVRSSRNPLGHVTQTQYNPDLTAKRIVDPKGQVYRFAYNSLGWMTSRYDLADTLSADQYAYDAAGRLRTVTNRKGQVVNLTYDAVGRMTSRGGGQLPTEAFRYDDSGRYLVATNASAYDSLVYDLAGRLNKAFPCVGGTTQGCSAGNMFEWRYGYDGHDLLSTRNLYRGGVAQSVGYLSQSWGGSRLSSTLAAGISIRFERQNAESLSTKRVVNSSWWMSQVLDSLHLPTRDTFSVAKLDSVFGGTFGRDSLNRLSSLDAHAARVPLHHRYDAAGRLTVACRWYSSTLCVSEYGGGPEGFNPYAYVAAGNRNDPAANAVIGAGNRTQQFKGYTLTYDANGNVISKVGNGKSWAYGWDALNRLVSVRQGGTLLHTLAYDALGRRILRGISGAPDERYVYDGDQVVIDLDGAGNQVLREYGWYPGTDRLLGVSNTGGWTGLA